MTHRRFIIALAFILLGGCATHPITGRSQLMLLPEQDVVRLSYQAFNEMSQKQPSLPATHEQSRRVQRIAERIIEQAVVLTPAARQWAWEIRVFKDPSVNAFAMAGGKIGVNTGMLERLQPSDDELAQVLAHEIAHVISGHSREQLSLAMSQQLALSVAGAALDLGRESRQVAAQVAELALGLPYSRTMEYEADRVGIELAARAGYDPEAALRLWRKMMNLNAGRQPPEWLSTHPSDENRLRAIQALMPAMLAIYQRAARP